MKEEIASRIASQFIQIQLLYERLKEIWKSNSDDILTLRRENGSIHSLYAVCCSNMKKVFCLREVHMDLEQQSHIATRYYWKSMIFFLKILLKSHLKDSSYDNKMPRPTITAPTHCLHIFLREKFLRLSLNSQNLQKFSNVKISWCTVQQAGCMMRREGYNNSGCDC